MPFNPSPARRGLDLLLERHPHLELVTAEWQREDAEGPWLLVTLGQRSDVGEAFALWPFAIWKSTGAVHGIGADGAVTDDPLYAPPC